MAAVCSLSTHLLHRFRAAPSVCACMCRRTLWRNPCSCHTWTSINTYSTGAGHHAETDGDAKAGSVLEQRGTALQRLRSRRARKGPRSLEFNFGGNQTLTLEEARALAAENAAKAELVTSTCATEEASNELEPATARGELEEEGRTDVPLSISRMKAMMSLARRHMADQPETIPLVEYLREHHELTAKDLHSYSKTLPSVVGTSVDDVRKRVAEFRSVGFKSSEIDFLLPRFPSLMNFDHQTLRNVHDVYRAMQTLHRPKDWLHGLLTRHKFLFLHDSKEVSTRLATLVNMGLSPQNIAAFLMKEPTFLFHPFSEDCQQRIRSLVAVGFSKRWVIKALYHSLHLHPARLELGPDAAKIVGVVRETLEANPDRLLVMCPQIFQMNVETLESIIRTLKGKPLYWDTRDLQCLVVKRPSIIPHLAAVKSLPQHLEDLCSAFMTALRTNRVVLLRFPPVILSEDVQGKVQVFREMGFTDEERVELISRTPTILLKNTRTDLELRLKLLLSIPNVTPAALIHLDGTSRKRSPLTSPLGVMQGRYEYIKKYNEQLLDVSQVNDIFVCSDDKLAEFCNQSMQDYYQEMDCFVVSQDGTGLASRRLRESPAATLQQKVSAVDATTEVCEKREGSLVGGVYEKAPPTGKAHGTQEIQDSDKVKQSTTEDSSDGKKKRKSRKAVSEKKVTSKMRTSGSKSKLAKLEAELATQEPEPTFMLEGIVDEGVDLLDLEDLEELEYFDDSEEMEESEEMFHF